MIKKLFLLIVFLLLGYQGLFSQSHTIFSIGSNTDSQSQALGGVCLMGGATENDEAMRWFLRQANEGDIVVLRTSGGDAYNNYFYAQLGVTINAVRTIVFHNGQASYDPLILQYLAGAEGIWIAGGDQSVYLNYWKNTPLDSIVRHKIQSDHAVIGGTSAGMAILGQAKFTAQSGTVTSSQLLNNPYHPAVVLDTSIFFGLPKMDKVITDTHYDNPDRKGRHLGFMARLATDFSWNIVRGIACDEYTAVCVDSNGMASVYGDYPTYDDNAYFLQMNCGIQQATPEVCISNQPLTWFRNGEAVLAYQVKGTPNGANTFNLNDWQSGQGGQWNYWHVQSGLLLASTAPPPNCINSTYLQEQHTRLSLRWNSLNNTLIVESQQSIIEAWQISSILGQKMADGGPVGSYACTIVLPTITSGLYLLEIKTSSGWQAQSFIVPH